MLGKGYEANLRAGLNYQRFVCKRLGLRQSDKGPSWEAEFGDTVCLCEIKLDRMFRQTGNLFLEFAESDQDPHDNQVWHTAAILTGARTLIQGDYQTCFRITSELALEWAESTEFRRIHNPRAKGVLVPVRVARDIAEVIEL